LNIPDSAIEASRSVSSPSQEGQFRGEMGKISRHSGVFFVGTMFTAVAGYFFRVYLARVLGPEPLGVYALGMTVVGLLGLVGGLGLSWAAARFVSVYRAQGKSKESWSLFVYGCLSLLLTNACLAAAMIAVRREIAAFYHSSALSDSIFYFAVLLLTGVLGNFFGQILIGHKEVARRTVLSSFVAGPVTMLLTIAFLARRPGLQEYLSAQTIGAVFGVLLIGWAGWRLTRKQGAFALTSPSVISRAIVSFSLAAFAMDLLGFITGQIDKVILGNILSAREVGIYATAATFVAFLPILLQSVNQIFVPTIAELHTKGQHEILERLFQTLTKWVLGLTLPLAFILIACARPVMRIFGPEFESGWMVLAIGTLGQVVNCASGSVGYLLLMSGNERRLIRVQIGMAVVMVVLTIGLVPYWGMAGAAFSAAAVNVGMNVWSLYEVKKSLGMTPYNATYWRLLPGLLAMAAVSIVILRVYRGWRFEWVGIGLSLLGAYVAFVAVVLVTGLDSDDKSVVAAVWYRLRGASVRSGS
jgi:O-antigen/teichoic acid export membrane protein